LNNDDTLRATPTTAGALSAHFTPLGHLRLVEDLDIPNLPAALHGRLIAAFDSGVGHGLLQLGATEIGTVLPPTLAWLREFASRYVTALCATAEDAEIVVPAPSDAALEVIIDNAPPIPGSEYLTPKTLIAI